MKKKLFSLAIALAMGTSAWSQSPKADLLDVVFNDDGTATDVSAMQNTLNTIGSPKILKSPMLNTNIFCLGEHPWASDPINFFTVPLTEELYAALEDGFSMECYVRPHWDGDEIPSAWNAPFSMEEGGGFGMIVDGKKWTFEIHTGGGYHQARAAMPVKGEWIHLIGVWNKEEGMAYIYANGELVSSTNAAGDLGRPVGNDLFTCIGGDYGMNGAQVGFQGDIAIARYFNSPLSAGEVVALYQDIQARNTGAEEHTDGTDIRYDEEGYILIATAKELNTFANLSKEGNKLNGKLEADIDYTDYNNCIASISKPYKGVFDGQGHKVKVNLSLDYDDAGFFEDAGEGSVIKNLILEGDIVASESWDGALIGDNEGATVENVICNITFTSTYANGNCWDGILSAYNKNTCIYRNCMVVGKVISEAGNGVAGLVCDVKGTTIMENCIAICSAELGGGVTTAGPVNGRVRGGASLTCKNVFYNIETDFGATPADCQGVTMAQFASGEVCYALNNGDVATPSWFQTIGTDPYPTLDNTHGIVMQAGDSYMSLDESTLEKGCELIRENELAYATTLEANKELLDAYLSSIEALKTCNSIPDFSEKLSNVYEKKNAVTANIEAYKAYSGKAESALKDLEGLTSSLALDLMDYLTTSNEPSEDFPNGSYVYITEGYTLGTEAVYAEIELIDQLVKRVMAADAPAGTEVTALLVNPDFKDGIAGWSGTTPESCLSNPYAVQFSGMNTAEIYQSFTELKNGIYLLTANGFYCTANQYAENTNYAAMLYANGIEVPLMTPIEDAVSFEDANDGINCLITEPGNSPNDVIYNETYYLPQSGVGASYALNGGRYLNKILVNVTDGTLKVGVRMDGSGNKSDWMELANVRLYYQGELAEAESSLDEVLAGMAARANTLITYEARTDETNYLYYPNYSKDTREALNANVAKISSAVGSEEKYALMESLTGLFQNAYSEKMAYINLAKTIEKVYDLQSSYSSSTEIISNACNEAWENWIAGIYSEEQALAKAQELMDMIASLPVDMPIADLFDVVFNEDGTATDVSPLHNEVKIGGTPKIIESPMLGMNVFCHNQTPWGESPEDFYRIDLTDEISNAILDGYTAEAYVRPHWDTEERPSEWVSIIGIEEGGGFGLLVQYNKWQLETHVGGGYKIASYSGPIVKDEWIHIVGVWNKEEGLAYFYVNGQLAGTVAAEGDFKFPSRSNMFFGIGGDYNGGDGVQNGFQGDIAIARLYDQPLNEAQVSKLWEKIDSLNTGKPEHDDATAITDVKAGKQVPEGIYNLMGQKVEKAQKGIYIIQGKKFIVK